MHVYFTFGVFYNITELLTCFVLRLVHEACYKHIISVEFSLNSYSACIYFSTF